MTSLTYPPGIYDMNTLLAAFDLVRGHPGGAVTLGPMLGKNAATLSQEINPAYPTAKLGLEDAVKLSVLTGDRRIATAFASELGCMLVALPAVPHCCTTLQAIGVLAREFSDLVGDFTEATADGKVTDNQMRRVESDAAMLVASVQVALQHIASLRAQASEAMAA